MDVQAWVDAYAKAWDERNADAAAELFSVDSEYRTHPFMDPNKGRDGVHTYWADVTSTQANVTCRMGKPFVDGNRATVEFWTTLENNGVELTLVGCLLLHFEPDGLCSRLREYWVIEEGTKQPHEGWGD